jgi:hypothetical protein
VGWMSNYIAKKTKSRKRPQKLFLRPSSISCYNNFEITLPILTISEANTKEHWHKSAKRHTAQQQEIHYEFKKFKHLIKLPCSVRVIRYAPRKLDAHDNLPMSLKWIVDQVCTELTGETKAGKADGDPRIKIDFAQVTSKAYGVKIIISF